MNEDKTYKDNIKEAAKHVIIEITAQLIILFLCSICILPIVFMLTQELGMTIGLFKLWRMTTLSYVLGRCFWKYVSY